MGLGLPADAGAVEGVPRPLAEEGILVRAPLVHVDGLHMNPKHLEP